MGKGQHGQTLILVALAMVVLLLFVGLAVDVGVWYGQRRKMQNAADAGALAGAWELCRPSTEGAAATKALEFAQLNGANPALTEVSASASTGTVVVTATTDADLYLSRLAITDFTIPAVAAAQCGPADSGCGMWPVAFDLSTYISTTLSGQCNGPAEWDGGAYENGRPDNSGADFHPGSQFILWADDNDSPKPEDLDKIARHCHFYSHPKGETPYKLADLMGGSPMDPGNRGWVALRLLPGFVVPPGSSIDDCNSAHNCGDSALNCWLEHGFIGPVSIGDCLASQPGVGDNSLRTYASLKEGDPVSILLYDYPGPGEKCTITEDDPTCGGNKVYHVAGIGCVRVEHVFHSKNCDGPCENESLDGKDSIFFVPRLGGTTPEDIEYTFDCTKTNEEPYPDTHPGQMGRDIYGYGCYRHKDGWKCQNKADPIDTCANVSTRGIVVTKLCACPPTDCVGTGSGSPNSSQDAVSLIRWPPEP